MAVKTTHTFNAVGSGGQGTTSFTNFCIQLNNENDLDVYVTLSGGTRVLQYLQSTASTADSNHPQVNDTTGLYFPAVSSGTSLTNYTISADLNTITFNSALASGAVVSVERRTRDASSNYTNFAGGSTIRSTDLNNAFDESNFTAQEARNKAFDLERKLFDGASSTSIKTKLDGIEASATADQTDAEIRAAVEAATDSNVFTDADHSKLDAIESGATADQTSEEIQDIVGAMVSGNTETGITVTYQDSDGTLDFAVTNQSDENFTNTLKTKLDGIEANAKDDQTASEIKTLIASSPLDASHLAADSVGASELADNSVASANIINGSITNDDIAANADIGGAKILQGSISNDKLMPGAITGSELANNVINKVEFIGAGGTAANDKVLVYDTNESTGWKWATQSGSGGSSLTVQEEGSSLSTAATTLNFVGANVTASGTGATKTITISGSGEITVQDEGSALSTAATTLNFVGSGVTASGTGATKTITISGGTGAVTTDFQYLELKAHNNASGAFSAGSADYELVTKGTTTAISPSEAAALLISVAGVIQQPNTGTSIGSNDGFCIDGSSIHFGANLAAHPDFILYLKGAGSHTIDDDSIAEVKLDISNTATDGQFLQYKDSTDKLTWASVTGTPEGTAVKSTTNSNEAATKFLRADGDGSCSWQVPSYTTNTDTQLTTEQVQDIVGAMFTGNTETNITATYEDSDGTIDLVSTDTNTQLTEEQVEDFVGGMVTGNTETGITVTYEDSDGTLDFVVADQTPEGTAILSTGETGTTKFLRVDGDNSCSWQVPPDTTYSVGDGGLTQNNFTNTLKTKLDGIAASANNYAISADLLDEDNMATNSATKVASQQSIKAYVDANSGGASADDCIYKNSLTISNAHTIAATEGAHSVGPITLNNTVTVNGRWVIS